MFTHTSNLSHRIEPEPQPLPGDFAIWIFIFAELLVFGVLFAAFAFARSAHVELFTASQRTLNRWWCVQTTPSKLGIGRHVGIGF